MASSKNPFGAFAGPKSHVVMAGTDVPAIEGARNFGKLRSGSVGVSGAGGRASGRSIAGIGSRGGERLFADNGEINASSDVDLIEKIGLLLAGFNGADPSHRGSKADRMFERTTSPEYSEVQTARAAALREAAAGGEEGHIVIGAALGDEVYETLGREGFGRNCLMTRDLGDQEVARVKVRKKDVVAEISTTHINTTRTMVRQHWVYPGEFYVSGYASMEEKEIAQAGTELLDDKYQDLLEQVLVSEDRHIKSRWDSSVGFFNPLLQFSTFTPLFFSQAKISVDHWGIPCTRAVMAWDLWNDIVAEPEFSAWFDPVTKHSLIMEGKLGALMDVQLITDGFRYDTLQVLSDGEMYFLGPQITVGTLHQRRPLQSEPTNRYNFGQPERGWFMFEIIACTTFPRAVSKAQRI